VRRARQVLFAPLHKLNLPPIRLFNKLSNSVLHMLSNAAVSKIQRFEHSVIAKGCTEIVVKSVNMHQFHNFPHCLLNI